MQLQSMLALLAMVSFVAAKPLHKGLNYKRYLAQKNETLDAFLKYKESDGFAAAMDLGLISKEDRDSDPSEDQLQRYHMATELCEQMRKLHPGAEFSVNGPFTLMTPDEFSNYVGLSKGDAGLQGTLLGARASGGSKTEDREWYDDDNFDFDYDSYNYDDDNDDDYDNGDDDNGGDDYDDDDDNNANDSDRTRKPGPVAPSTAPGPAPGPAPRPAPGPSDGSGVDWMSKGCVTAVRNQGQCGSCWAFSTTAAIESAMCIKSGSGKCTELSEQQITSCDTQNSGCGGGVPAYAMDYVKQNGGLCSLESYPYKSASKGQCNSGCTKVPISINKAVPVTGDESNLAKALDKQPVVVAVAAGNNAWKQYTGGVLSGCDTNNIDHAVLAYGYTNDAWLIKNSWGTSWGEKGMIRLARNTGGKGCCGIMSQAVYPELA